MRLVAAFVAALVLVPSGYALDCPNVPLEERLAAADAAFVGRIVSSRPRGAEIGPSPTASSSTSA